MHPNQARLEHFYDAFARLDAGAMAACYAPDACFDDEVFSLRGDEQIGGMWHMLCEATQARHRDAWKLSYRSIVADADCGQAHWEAQYRFSASGRKVHNVIDGVFEFDEAGLISRHTDRFDFWRWARQALGVPGALLGWTPFFRSQVKRQAAANLQKYLAKRKTEPTIATG